LEALNSEQWTKMSFESVKEVLGMEFLNCDEAELVRAVVRWGGGECPAKIVACLELIRFAGISATQFADLSRRELQSILTLEEKHSILMALVTGDWSSMPAFVGRLLHKRGRHVQVITFNSSASSSDEIFGICQ
jgi:BTB And C-terminal Kelch